MYQTLSWQSIQHLPCERNQTETAFALHFIILPIFGFQSICRKKYSFIRNFAFANYSIADWIVANLFVIVFRLIFCVLAISTRCRTHPDRMHVWVCKNVCPFLPPEFQSNSIKSSSNHIHLHPFPFHASRCCIHPTAVWIPGCQHSWTPGLLHGNVSLKFEFILRITNSQHVCHSTCHSVVVAVTFSVCICCFSIAWTFIPPRVFVFFFCCCSQPFLIAWLCCWFWWLYTIYFIYIYIYPFARRPADWCLCARQCPLFDFSFISKICNAPHVATGPVPCLFRCLTAEG